MKITRNVNILAFAALIIIAGAGATVGVAHAVSSPSPQTHEDANNDNTADTPDNNDATDTNDSDTSENNSTVDTQNDNGVDGEDLNN